MGMRGHADRSRRGFTMMEMMGAVAILAIVALISVPPLMHMARQLRMMQLDAEAQQIYNSVQNRLSALKASGQAPLLFGEESLAASKVTARPADYPAGAAFNDEQHALYHLSSDADSAVARYLFTTSDAATSRIGASDVSSALLDGSFVVELCPLTGEVYSVYYWEGPGQGKADAINPRTGSKGAITWDDVHDLRSREERAPFLVGYYGGGALSPYFQPKIDESERFGDLSLDLVNSEELYARVRSESIGKLVGNAERLATFKVQVAVEGISYKDWNQKATWERTYSPASSDPACRLTLRQSDTEVDVILDSMREGLSFAEICRDAHILPGSDLNVTVRVYCDVAQDDPTSPLRESRFTTNSLYQELSGGTVKVSCLRHLRNLDLRAVCAKTGEADLGGYTFNFANYTHIDVERDIDFDGNAWWGSPECVSIQSRQDFAGNGLNPNATFAPIVASAEMVANPSNEMVGGDHTLKNFVIASDAERCGVFSSMFFTVRDLNMEDPRVTGTTNVGSLVGEHTSGSIHDCHVVTTGKDGVSVTGTGDNVGGLVGLVTGWVEIDNCSAAIDVSGGSHVGGLIGESPAYTQFTNCNVGYEKNDLSRPRLVSVSAEGDYAGGLVSVSSADMHGNHVLANVSGASYVGGLAGEVLRGTIVDCRVGNTDEQIQVNVSGTGNYVGGLTGVTPAGGSGDIVLANVSGGSYVGGLVGDLTSGSLESSSVAVRMDAPDSERETVYGSGSRVGGAVGRQSGAVSTVTSSADVWGEGNAVGGLVGESLAAIYGSSVHGFAGDDGILVYPHVTSRGIAVGGLVGYHPASALITGSFASTLTTNENSSGEYCGGLVGNAASCMIQNCYSSGSVRGHELVGGFVGYREGGWWNSCFTCCKNVEGDRIVGGFVGFDAEPSNLSTCAAYGRTTKAYHASYVGAFAGYTRDGSRYSEWSGLLYFVSANINNDFVNYHEYNLRLGYYECVAEASGYPRPPETHPSNAWLVGLTYPFRTVSHNGAVLPFYGDWPVPSA